MRLPRVLVLRRADIQARNQVRPYSIATSGVLEATSALHDLALTCSVCYFSR